MKRVYPHLSAHRLCLAPLKISGVAVGAILTLTAVAQAADLPRIKIGDDNLAPACATPGRLQAFLEERNPALDKRFHTVAFEYVRLGDALGVRWDYAFFQMMRETGALTYKGDARFGTEPDRNNFAGLRPVEKDSSYERFPDVATGVRAHLEHLLFYAGDKVAEPASKRTQRQQQSDPLSQWRKDLAHPVGFNDLAAKWTDGSDTYARTIEKLSASFTAGACQKDDPHPELEAKARPQAAASTKVAAAEPAAEKVRGADLARRAMADGAAATGATNRSGLGAGAATAPVMVKIINAPAEDMPAPAAQDAIAAAPPTAQATANAKRPAAQRTAAAGTAAKALVPQEAAPVVQAPAAVPASSPAEAAGAKCRVFTASYGGRSAVIVKAVVDQVANFTVLDVNEGQETREAEAFIAAYAKGGSVAGQFKTQNQALEKAFELCPEG